MSVVSAGQVPAPERKGLSRGWVIGLSIAGAAFIVMAAAVVAGVSFLFGFGMDIFEDQVRRDIQDNPVIAGQIGVIQEIELDFAASANETHPEVFVFNLQGSKGRGTLTARCVTTDDATEEVVEGRLVTASGKIFELFAGQASGR